MAGVRQTSPVFINANANAEENPYGKRQSGSPLGQRPPERASTFAEMSSPLKHRRSSTFSDSVEDAKTSIKSSTDDLLLPRSAQIPDTPSPRRDWSENTIIEEEGEDEQHDNAAGKHAEYDKDGSKKRPRDVSETQEQNAAASELRVHELLALFACFLSPLLGAWLLHAIRSQLSRPSEGLVSNYNLTIFLLAAEVRPLSHLIKMVQARTLYLQRTIGSYSHDEHDNTATTQLSKRLDELEAFAAKSLPTGKAPSTDAELSNQIKTEVRNSMQPDLDALNRAVRRYEKRIVALTMQTESRLQELESRMSDAITLAAAAERSSTQQRSRRGSSTLIILDWASAAILLPARTAWAAVSIPAKLAGMLIGTMESYVGNKVKREMKTAGRTSSGHNRKSNTGSRGSKKPF
ncbi:MAG: hypothetical protein Q9222_007224 [Ikaeria aurantiellina]